MEAVRDLQSPLPALAFILPPWFKQNILDDNNDDEEVEEDTLEQKHGVAALAFCALPPTVDGRDEGGTDVHFK